jgi:hypothetical protein
MSQLLNETFQKHLKLLHKKLNENSPQSQKIDNIFDEFLEKMKDVAAPEAAKTILEQVMSIREQLRKERDLQNFQRLKLLMIKQIKELREALGDDKELITAYNEFLNSYVNNKENQLDEADGLKQNLEDLISKTRIDFIELSVEFGNLDDSTKQDIGQTMRWDDIQQRFNWDNMRSTTVTVGSRGLIDFIKSLEGRLQGYDWVDVEPANSYMEEYLRFISNIIIKAKPKRSYSGTQPAEDEKQIQTINNIKNITKNTINNLTEIKKTLNTMRVLIEKTKLRLLRTTNVVV